MTDRLQHRHSHDAFAGVTAPVLDALEPGSDARKRAEAAVADLIDAVVTGVDELPYVAVGYGPQAQRIAEHVTEGEDLMDWGSLPRAIAEEALQQRLAAEGRLAAES